jgi:chemotaxis signal transduction protein
VSDVRSRPEVPAAEVLRQRAARLAQPPEATSRRNGLQALGFTAAGQRCLLELGWLREVQPLRDLAPLSFAAPHLLGLASWRGRMLPVLDLASLLSTPESVTDTRACQLLVLGRERPALALAVAGIHGLQALPAGDVERRSQPLEGLRPEIVRGLTADGQLLLDAEPLLALHRAAGP